MNKDAWENLDTWERRDHELIREYLNDGPVRLGEQQLKAGMNNPEMMGSGGKEMKTTHEMLPDGWKEFSRSKQLWEDGLELEPRISERTDKI